MRQLVVALTLAALLAGAGRAAAVSLAEDGGADGAATVWAPYVVVGESTIEVQNVGDHPTWPRITVYLRVAQPARSYCYGGVCAYGVQAPRIEPGESWTFDLADRACGKALPPTICLPDGAQGGVSIEAAVETGTGANAGATTADPDGRIAAQVTVATGTYDAVTATTSATFTDVGRRVEDADGLTTAIRIVGVGGVRVGWYRDDELVADQLVGVGTYCCGETGSFQVNARAIDPRLVDGLDDDAVYTVVITDATGNGTPFAAVLTDAPEEP